MEDRKDRNQRNDSKTDDKVETGAGTATVTATAADASGKNLEESLMALDKELDVQSSRNDGDDVHSMLRLAGLVVRQAARSLLRSTSRTQIITQHASIGAVLTMELRQRLRELATMLNSVHDDQSANHLNNYSFGTLGKYSSERASIASTVVNISISPPSFKPVALFLARSPLF